jgi:hypothetical protein
VQSRALGEVAPVGADFYRNFCRTG